MKIIRKIITKLLILVLFSNFAIAQKIDIHEYLNMVMNGKTEIVKSKLLDLIAESPDDPGIIFLHGLVLDDKTKALAMFQRIIEKYPDSDWADDSYYQIIQYYVLNNNMESAAEYLVKFKKSYPHSDLLFAASSLAENYSKESLPANNQSSAKPVNLKDYESPPAYNEKSNDDSNQMVAKLNFDEKSTSKDTIANSDNKVSYGLQIGAFANQETAQVILDKYVKQRFYAEIIVKEVNGNNLFCVVIGNYSSKQTAENEKEEISKYCSCDPQVVKKSISKKKK